MGYTEDALRLLGERYHERFEFVRGVRVGQIHLFLVKGGLWSLAWTFIPKHFEEFGLNVGIDEAARLVLAWLGDDGLSGQRLDASINEAIKRVEERLASR
ncbi:MAG: hypothetical protein QW514_05335 [Thermoprotei archaeon]